MPPRNSRSSRSGRLGGQTERLDLQLQAQHVGPGLFLGRSVAQQIGRMQRRDGLDLMAANGHPGPLAAHLDDAACGLKDGLHGGSAQSHHQLGCNQFDLSVQKGQAKRHFLGRRGAIAGWTPRHGIGDIDLGAIKPDRCQHTVKQLSRLADKGFALPVLFGPRRFADQHDVGNRIAIGKHQLGRPQFQPAPVIVFQQRLQLVQGLGRCRQTACFAGISANSGGLDGTLRWCGARHCSGGRCSRRTGRWSLCKAVDRLFAHGDIHASGAIPIQHGEHFVVI